MRAWKLVISAAVTVVSSNKEKKKLQIVADVTDGANLSSILNCERLISYFPFCDPLGPAISAMSAIVVLQVADILNLIN